MVRMRLFFNTLLVSLLLPLYSPLAADKLLDLNINATYLFTFSGLTFGKATILSEQDAGHYALTADVSSTGIASLLLRHSSQTTAKGIGAAHHYTDITFASDYQTRKKKRSVKIAYKNGEVVMEDTVPPENRDKRPAVAASAKKNSVDPLSVMLGLRKQLDDARTTGKTAFSLTMYDGRRLTQLDSTVLGDRKILYNGKKKSTLAISVRRKLLAGFTESELADYNPKEPALTIYFSNDARLVPLKLEIPMLLGLVTATLRE